MNTVMRLVGVLFLSVYAFWAEAQHTTYVWKENTEGGYTYQYVNDDPTHTRFYKMKNGLTVILSPNNKQPRIQTYIATKAGSKTDPIDQTGLAHYLEHLLFKGTDKFGTLDWTKEQGLLDQIEGLYQEYNMAVDDQVRTSIYRKIDSVSGLAAQYAIANEYDKIMSSIGANGTNAFTSFEQTVYMEDIPNNVVDKFLAVQQERFRKPIFRLFHTELETVYEEKNMALDNDNRKAMEAFFTAMFQQHNYGKQTILGSVEHLKNPSLSAIREYYESYYVPNNMGIIMCGDFNPTDIVTKIDQAFSYMGAKEVPTYNFDAEQEISSPVVREVFGPNPEFILLGFRFPGAGTYETQMLTLMSNILSNGAAGLIDLNVNKAQKLLNASVFPYVLKDYSMLVLEGRPLDGQSLEEVRAILMDELEKLRKGEFDEELLTAIVNNEKKAQIMSRESYKSLANDLMNTFSMELDWANELNYIDWISTVKKKDIVDFATKYLKDNNYGLVLKRQGTDLTTAKVAKPAITPVSVNRTDKSSFFKEIERMPESDIAPAWVDYEKSIHSEKIGDTQLYSVKNIENELFTLTYHFNVGRWNDKLLSLAANYIEYIGTTDKSNEEISKAFYALASEFSVNSGSKETSISVSGLDVNFEKSLALLHDLLKNCVADETAFTAYKERLKKSRTNAKDNKNAIVEGLRAYAKYGSNNPFNFTLTDTELESLRAEDLIKAIHDLSNTKHTILYYGPRSSKDLAANLSALKTKGAVSPYTMTAEQGPRFKERATTHNEVLFANYKMNQVDIHWHRNSEVYDKKKTATLSLFNSYFGGGMGSIVFQTLRESKALAYSTYAGIAQPAKEGLHYSIYAYIGTQADKFQDAVNGMEELFATLPNSTVALETARVSLAKSLASQRITGSGILTSFMAARRLGNQEDLRKSIFEELPSISYADLAAFHNGEFTNKAFTYCIVGDQESLKEEDIQKLGPVRKLTLDEIFGY